jgi:hypothetical protein
VRNIEAIGYDEKNPFRREEVIFETKTNELNIQPKTSGNATLNVTIPYKDIYAVEYDQLPKDLQEDIKKEDMPMMQNFTASFFGQIVKVWYSMIVYVKHAGMCDFGEGADKRIPIKIFSRYENIMGNQVAFNTPAVWNPQIMAEADLDFEGNDAVLNANAQNQDYATNSLIRSQTKNMGNDGGESSSEEDDNEVGG